MKEKGEMWKKNIQVDKANESNNLQQHRQFNLHKAARVTEQCED